MHTCHTVTFTFAFNVCTVDGSVSVVGAALANALIIFTFKSRKLFLFLLCCCCCCVVGCFMCTARWVPSTLAVGKCAFIFMRRQAIFRHTTATKPLSGAFVRCIVATKSRKFLLKINLVHTSISTHIKVNAFLVVWMTQMRASRHVAYTPWWLLGQVVETWCRHKRFVSRRKLKIKANALSMPTPTLQQIWICS